MIEQYDEYAVSTDVDEVKAKEVLKYLEDHEDLFITIKEICKELKKGEL